MLTLSYLGEQFLNYSEKLCHRKVMHTNENNLSIKLYTTEQMKNRPSFKENDWEENVNEKK